MNKCKEYQVKGETVQCFQANKMEQIEHSEYCLKEQELREKYKGDKVEVNWDAKRRIWTTTFDYLNEKKTTKKKEETELDFEREE